MAKGFIDTNIYFHSVDPTDLAKRAKAVALLTQLAEDGTGYVSTQVAMELAANFIKKLKRSPADVEKLLRGLDDFNLIPTGPATVRRALELMTLASLSFWDAAIIAAAEAGGCDTLYTEDLNAGQVIAGVKIVDPF